MLEAIHQQVQDQENSFRIHPDDLKDLNDRNFIYLGDKIALRDKGRALFEDDNMKVLFEEFYNEFPSKTPVSGRRLRAFGIDSMNGQQAWSIYKRLIKNKSDHEKLMSGLNAELIERSSGNGLEYMHNILAWLRAGSWQMYDINESNEESFIEIG